MTFRKIAVMAAFAFLVVVVSQGVQAQNVALVSKLGGKCLNAEGGTKKGARLIGYNCDGGSNELFWFNQNGTIEQGGLCLDASGGAGRDGDQIVLWDCNGGPNQKWRLEGNRLVGINNKCLDLKDGANPIYWVKNQPAILWSCNGGDNQTWFKGLIVPKAKISGASFVNPGDRANMRPGNLTAQEASRVITMGGGNVITMGGGNVITMGGGNVIAMGGGNVLALVKGN